jgi:Ni,Fe-hydrogenase III small subunit
MVKLWILRGLKKGVLTTKYPKVDPSVEELPRKSSAPIAVESTNWASGEKICPTGAIHAENRESKKGVLDLGKCIYCQRCSEAGFLFSDDRKSGYMAASIADKDLKEEELFNQYGEAWKTFKRSFHILLIDVGSCNACNLEVLNLSNPYYDLNRLGIFFTNSPKHADALVVVGALNKAMVDVLKRTYESIPTPKIVIVVGACPISGGIFRGTSGFASPVSDVIPVDVVVPGCPPTPIQILEGLLMAMGKIEPRHLTLTSIRSKGYDEKPIQNEQKATA